MHNTYIHTHTMYVYIYIHIYIYICVCYVRLINYYTITLKRFQESGPRSGMLREPTIGFVWVRPIIGIDDSKFTEWPTRNQNS